MLRITMIALCLAPLLLGCSDDTSRPTPDQNVPHEGGMPDQGVPDQAAPVEGGATGKEQITVNEDLLGALEVRFLKGRCLGRASINANDADARAAVVGFVQALVATIPLDGSKPTSDSELTALVPGDNVIDDWAEDPADTTKGPWLITTSAFDWIDGGGQPFEDNGFEAAAGEKYLKPGKTWELGLELVNMASTTGAEAAFKGAKWDEGKAP
jgi:hypothetical protein